MMTPTATGRYRRRWAAPKHSQAAKILKTASGDAGPGNFVQPTMFIGKQTLAAQTYERAGPHPPISIRANEHGNGISKFGSASLLKGEPSILS